MDATDTSNLLVEICVAAASLCVGGVVSYIVYVRHRQALSFQLLKGSFPNVINFSLTFFDGDTMHIRTLFETDLFALTRNNVILVDIVQRARRECREDAAFLQEPKSSRFSSVSNFFSGSIPWASATQHLHMLIYNELISRYSSRGEIARIAGVKTKEVPFYFGVTCEQGVDLQGTKIRVILIQKDQLLLETGEEREELPSVSLPGQMIRYRSLCEMRRRVLEEHDMMNCGIKIVRRVWELLLAVEVPFDDTESIDPSVGSEERDLVAPALPQMKLQSDAHEGENRLGSKESNLPAIILPSPSMACGAKPRGTTASFLSEYDELSMPTATVRQSTREKSCIYNEGAGSSTLRAFRKTNNRLTMQDPSSGSRRTIAPKLSTAFGPSDEKVSLKISQMRHGNRLMSHADIERQAERQTSRRNSRESLASNMPHFPDPILPSSVDNNHLSATFQQKQRGGRLQTIATSSADVVPKRESVHQAQALHRWQLGTNAHGTGGTHEQAEHSDRLLALEERVEKMASSFEQAQAQTLAKLSEVLAELRKGKTDANSAEASSRFSTRPGERLVFARNDHF